MNIFLNFQDGFFTVLSQDKLLWLALQHMPESNYTHYTGAHSIV
jgi:hypothetical protein